MYRLEQLPEAEGRLAIWVCCSIESYVEDLYQIYPLAKEGNLDSAGFC